MENLLIPAIVAVGVAAIIALAWPGLRYRRQKEKITQLILRYLEINKEMWFRESALRSFLKEKGHKISVTRFQRHMLDLAERRQVERHDKMETEGNAKKKANLLYLFKHKPKSEMSQTAVSHP